MKITDRVLAVLKPLVASKGFGATTIEGLATNLSTSLTDESTDEEITTAIDGAMPYLNLMQSENTRYINEYKKKNPAQTNPNPATEPNPTNLNPAPEASSTDKIIAELAKKVDTLLNQSSQLSLQQKWDKLAEANGITNEKLIAKWKPSTEEEFDSAMEELKEFNKDFVKQQANTLSPGKPNAGEGGGGSGKSKELTSKGKEALEEFKKAQERRAKK